MCKRVTFELLGLFGLTMAALASGGSSSPSDESRSGSYHWHVVTGGKRKYYFEQIGISSDGYPKLQCPFCESEYVKRR
jgi:hypothetical protein